MPLEFDEHLGEFGASARTPLRQCQRKSCEQTVVHATVERAGDTRQNGLGDRFRQFDIDTVGGRQRIDAWVERTRTQQWVGARENLGPQRDLGLACALVRRVDEPVRPSTHGGADRSQCNGLFGGSLSPRDRQIGQENSPRHAVDDEVVRDDEQNSRPRRPAIVVAVEPNNFEHPSRFRIQATLRRVERFLGACAKCGVVDRRIRGHTDQQGVDIDGAGLADTERPLTARCSLDHRTQHVVVIDHGCERSGEQSVFDAGGKYDGHGLREASEASRALHDRPHDRSQSQRADSPARQFLHRRAFERLTEHGRYLGETDDRLTFEDIARGERNAPSPSPRHQLNGNDAVTAEREERLVDADPFDVQNIGEHLGDDRLDLVARAAEFLLLEYRLRQRGPVELADRCQRYRIENDDRGRHHVTREHARNEGRELGCVDSGVAGRQHVRDESCCAVG